MTDSDNDGDNDDDNNTDSNEFGANLCLQKKVKSESTKSESELTTMEFVFPGALP